MHLKTKDSLNYETKLIQKDRVIFSLVNEGGSKKHEATKDKIKIKYIKEPTPVVDSMAVYYLMYAKIEQQASRMRGEIKVKELK